MLFNEGLCLIQTDALPLDSMDTTQAVRTGEVEMTATLQSANDRLRPKASNCWANAAWRTD